MTIFLFENGRLLYYIVSGMLLERTVTGPDENGISLM